MKTVYISGAISGTKDYIKKFEQCEDLLVSNGYTVINPAKILSGLPENTSYELYMTLALDMLKYCDYIYMIEDWKSSNGAKTEYDYAISNNISILSHDKLLSTKYNVNQFVWIFNDVNFASDEILAEKYKVVGIEQFKLPNNSSMVYYKLVNKDKTLKKFENDIFETKKECDRAIQNYWN